jgi:hypothetical protein
MLFQTLQEPPVAGDLAQGLLTAWNSRDAGKVSAELAKTLSVSLEIHSSGELERLQLLLAIAERIQDCDNRFSRPGENPALDLWLSLLKHLAVT